MGILAGKGRKCVKRGVQRHLVVLRVRKGRLLIVKGMSSEIPDGLAGKRRESVKEGVKKHPIVYQGRLGRV